MIEHVGCEKFAEYVYHAIQERLEGTNATVLRVECFENGKIETFLSTHKHNPSVNHPRFSQVKPTNDSVQETSRHIPLESIVTQLALKSIDVGMIAKPVGKLHVRTR